MKFEDLRSVRGLLGRPTMRSYRGPLMLAALIVGGTLQGCSGCVGCMEGPSYSGGSGCGAGLDFGDGGCFIFCPSDASFDTRRDRLDSAPGIDTGLACRTPLPSGYECPPPIERPAGTSCTDEAIDALLNCFGAGDSKKCGEARKAFPECATCMLGDRPADGGTIGVGWMGEHGLDQAACVRAIDPTGACATVVHCTARCVDDSCFECIYESDPAWAECRQSVLSMPLTADANADADGDAHSDGDTHSDSDSDSDADADAISADTSVEDALDADAAVTDGAVCDRFGAAAFAECTRDPRFEPCFPKSIDGLRTFYRGACRDGAKWSLDAGADAGSDSDGAD